MSEVPLRDSHQPSEGGGVVFYHCLDMYHKLPDSGERQYKSRSWTTQCESTLGAGGAFGGLLTEP